MKFFDVKPNWNWKEFYFELPFSNGNIWIECDLDNNVYYDISIRKMYNVKPKFQRLLGTRDSMTLLSIGFLIPFRKSSNGAI
jgi:hypothetical protein